MQKRGQFFLIAALILVGVIAGLATVYNVTTTLKEDAVVFDLSQELNFEGSRVLERGVYNDLTDEEIIEKIKEIMNHYATLTPTNDFVGIYGNEEDISVILYSSDNTGIISVILGGGEIIVLPTGITRGVVDTRPRPEEDTIIIDIGDEQISFDLLTGQTLFMIVTKEKEDERFVAAPEGYTIPSQES